MLDGELRRPDANPAPMESTAPQARCDMRRVKTGTVSTERTIELAILSIDKCVSNYFLGGQLAARKVCSGT